jgi:ABC-type lipoprotein export system ATPase subunit
VIEARGLAKSYGTGRAARRVLDGVDLDVEAGELVAVTGRSGSGKSTLLHLLGTLDKPDAGSVRLAGTPVHDRGERSLAELRRRHVGFVFQFFHLIPELTGEENVMLAARLGRTRNGGSQPRTRRLLSQLGLDSVAGSRPHELSGGEQQRFALARALVNEPDALFADEPTGNLDSAAADQVLELLTGAARGGRAVVLVTHDRRAASAVADRVFELANGRLRS